MICWWYLVTSKESSNPILFFGKDLFFVMCKIFFELPSYISTMLDARDPPGTYPYFFRVTPLIVRTYAAYFMDFPAYFRNMAAIFKKSFFWLTFRRNLHHTNRTLHYAYFIEGNVITIRINAGTSKKYHMLMILKVSISCYDINLNTL